MEKLLKFVEQHMIKHIMTLLNVQNYQLMLKFVF